MADSCGLTPAVGKISVSNSIQDILETFNSVSPDIPEDIRNEKDGTMAAAKLWLTLDPKQFNKNDFCVTGGVELKAEEVAKKAEEAVPAEELEAAVAVCKKQEAVESVKEQADVEEQSVQEEQTEQEEEEDDDDDEDDSSESEEVNEIKKYLDSSFGPSSGEEFDEQDEYDEVSY